LARKQAGRSRLDETHGAPSRVVAPGLIHMTGDTESVSVELRIDDFEVDLRAGRAELGNWLTEMVTIRRIDDASYEFIAEGDRLIFVPDDPEALAHHPIVIDPSAMKRRDRRRVRKDEAKAAKEAARAAERADKVAARTTREAEKQAARAAKRADKAAGKGAKARGAQPAPEPQASPSGSQLDVIPSLQQRMAAIRSVEAWLDPEPVLAGEPETTDAPSEPNGASVTEPLGAAVQTTDDTVREAETRRHAAESPEPVAAVPPTNDRYGNSAVPVDTGAAPIVPDSANEPRLRSRLRRGRHREVPVHDDAPPGDVDNETSGQEEEPNRLWIRVIDLARKHDLLGLDRVPIDESLRGREHQHTWDHRVAWKTGPGAHICTICGKVRRSAEEPATVVEASEQS